MPQQREQFDQAHVLQSEPTAGLLADQFAEHLRIEPNAPAFHLTVMLAPKIREVRLQAFHTALAMAADVLRQSGDHAQADEILDIKPPQFLAL